jgi:hypothetical protein
LGDHLQERDEVQATTFLRDLYRSTLHALEIIVDELSATLQDALVHFIAKSASLRSLKVFVRNFPVTFPDAIFTAIDSGTRCLEEFGLTGPGKIADAWNDSMKPILKLNRYRHANGDLYESVGGSESDRTNRLRLVQAVELEDTTHDMLFELLRRNEWHIWTLMREYVVSEEQLCRHKRKREHE